jgi:capsular polysaccharide biosynthesis protein
MLPPAKDTDPAKRIVLVLIAAVLVVAAAAFVYVLINPPQ